MEYKLSQKHEYEGKTYETIKYNIESLAGNDYSDVTREYLNEGNVPLMLSYNTEVVIRLIARSAKIPVEVLKSLPIKDYCGLVQQAVNFLNA